MLISATVTAILNAVGGRGWFPRDRLICRGILIPLCIGLYAYLLGFHPWNVAFVTLSALIGFCLWFPWGHSFDEQHGKYDATKYHRWIQRVGLYVFPLDYTARTNRLRGILMKGLRGMYLYPMWVLLTAFDFSALLYGLSCATQGFNYWLASKMTPGRYHGVAGEFLDGFVKGGAIFMFLNGAGYGG